ncbi:hypothetical protein H9P43_003961 [Blastocladiella emersonii ATCC 22665]|nr:hypothetical protein H9P43_003961 [Blastocladiella emersonii ATCC 22665]
MMGRDPAAAAAAMSDCDVLMSDLDPPPPSVSARQPVFAEPDRVSQAAAYINQELAMDGLAPLQFEGATTEQAADILNVVYMLLQQRRSDRDYRADLEANMHRLRSDYQTGVTTAQRLQAKVDARERELRDHIARLTKLDTQHRDLVERSKNTAEELKLCKANFAKAKDHFMHEKRKWERELTAAKVKFQRLTTDRLKEAKLSFRVANNVLPAAASSRTGYRAAGASRTTTTTTSPETDYHLQVLRAVEAREQQLLAENDALKRAMYDIWMELQNLHSTCVDGIQVIDLPFELVRETVLDRTRQAIAAVRDEWYEHTDAALAAAEAAEAAAQANEAEEKIQQTNHQIDALTDRILSSMQAEVVGMDNFMGTTLAPASSAPAVAPAAAGSSRLADIGLPTGGNRPPAVAARAAGGWNQFAGRPLSFTSDTDESRARIQANYQRMHEEQELATRKARELDEERQRIRQAERDLEQRQAQLDLEQRKAAAAAAAAAASGAAAAMTPQRARLAAATATTNPRFSTASMNAFLQQLQRAEEPMDIGTDDDGYEYDQFARGPRGGSGASDAYGAVANAAEGEPQGELEAGGAFSSIAGNVTETPRSMQTMTSNHGGASWFGNASRIGDTPGSLASSPHAAVTSAPPPASSSAALFGTNMWSTPNPHPDLNTPPSNPAAFMARSAMRQQQQQHVAATPSGPSAAATPSAARTVKISPQSVAYTAGGGNLAVSTALGSSFSSSATASRPGSALAAASRFGAHLANGGLVRSHSDGHLGLHHTSPQSTHSPGHPGGDSTTASGDLRDDELDAIELVAANASAARHHDQQQQRARGQFAFNPAGMQQSTSGSRPGSRLAGASSMRSSSAAGNNGAGAGAEQWAVRRG